MIFFILLIALFSISVFILLWYYVYYFARIAFYKVSPNENKTSLPPVSVIICARNEAIHLPQSLPLILNQDYPCYEVIVVDDASYDTTPDILKEFAQKYPSGVPGKPRLKIITVQYNERHPHGKKFALMLGIKGAQYEHLVFTDADCKPVSTQWLKKMASAFSEKTEIVLGYCQYQKERSLLNTLIRFDAVQIAILYLSFALAGRPYMGVGRNLAYTKSLFFRNKGFASHYYIESGDDDLFVQEAATTTNTVIEISPESFTISQSKRKWRDWFWQKKRHLLTAPYYRLQYKIALSIYPLAQYIFWISFILLLFFFFGTTLPITSNTIVIYAICALGLLRLLVQHIVFKLAMNKLQEQNLFLFSLLGEWLLLGFYPIVWISNKFHKQVKWR